MKSGHERKIADDALKLSTLIIDGHIDKGIILLFSGVDRAIKQSNKFLVNALQKHKISIDDVKDVKLKFKVLSKQQPLKNKVLKRLPNGVRLSRKKLSIEEKNKLIEWFKEINK
ncbi:hypothetical protein [Heyndrickxia acidicola]|uniref:Uncharacterized protein n=1 Tax=Heyndrickxia acidicola TaxID=209389 RepID=A0ABU6MHP1_9BACI|nr:hypothetical protein [Heyndrickxia acidicola]MED1203526.1 hypothetical protein [Heyndrickxia acidicola]